MSYAPLIIALKVLNLAHLTAGMTTDKWQEIPPATVRLDELEFSQPQLVREALVDPELGSYSGDEYPHVVEHDGKLYVEDGNHRMTRHIVRGRKTARARVLRALKGGTGSGNFGHKGRPGKRGGSAAGGGIPINRGLVAHVIERVYDRYNRELVDDAVKQIREAVADADISMRVPDDVFLTILEEGQFKNQHETYTSQGTLNPIIRAEAERTAFGEHMNSPEDFPVYGYMATAKHNLTPDVDMYGNIKIAFNTNIRARTTITVGDSLADFIDGTVAPSPLNKPGPESLDHNVRELEDVRKGRHAQAPGGYIEAQIHGRLTTKDIKHVYIPKSAASVNAMFDIPDPEGDRWVKIKASLDTQGIPYTEYDHYMQDVELL